MFNRFRGRLPLTFLEYRYNYRIAVHEDRYEPYGRVISWDEFSDAFALLDQVKPDRVVFFFNASLTQVALKLAAQKRGITTYHLEHGFRLRYADYEKFEDTRVARRHRRLGEFVSRSPREIICALKEHAFFWRSTLQFAPPIRRRLAGYGVEIYKGDRSPQLRRAYGDIRRVDRYIAHAPEDFEQHWVEDKLDEGNFQGVYYIGLPQFDYLFGTDKQEVDPKKVILIDHQFHNANDFGWTLEFRRVWTARLADMIQRLGLRLLIKRHPGDVSDSWNPHLRPGEIELIDFDGLRRHVPSTRMILGNASSMQLPLTGMDHTVLVTLEIHPEPHFLSEAFVRAGVARAIVTFEELEDALRHPDVLFREQQPHKAAFVRQFLHLVDGAAGERLLEVVTGRPGISTLIEPRVAAQHLYPSEPPDPALPPGKVQQART
jgi:hypothetical protein